jgi:hypothetical protein
MLFRKKKANILRKKNCFQKHFWKDRNASIIERLIMLFPETHFERIKDAVPPKEFLKE